MMTLTRYDIEEVFDHIEHKFEMTPYEHILCISEVGSFMWGMGNEDDPDVGISDHDIVVIYQVPTTTILRDESYLSNLPCKHDVIINNKRFDFSYMEVGHFINLLIKGNINAIWVLTSPLVYHDTWGILQMREYITLNITSFNLLLSGLGMVTSQITDADRRAMKRPPQKNINGAYRTLKFLENIYINDCGIQYDSVNDTTLDECKNLLTTFREITSLNLVDHSSKLRDILYNIRIKEM